MDKTLDLIQKYANERQTLMRLSGKQRLTQEQRNRMDELSSKLLTLWNTHRGELAGGAQGGVRLPVKPARKSS